VSGERASFGHMVLLFVVMLVVHWGPQVEWEVLYLKACALGTSALHFLTELSFPVSRRGAFESHFEVTFGIAYFMELAGLRASRRIYL
jgi:hypothetical protein